MMVILVIAVCCVIWLVINYDNLIEQVKTKTKKEMPTPRPFNAPTEFKPNISPLGEVTRQVERMKALNKPTPKANVNPMQWYNKYIKNIKVPSVKVPSVKVPAAVNNLGKAVIPASVGALKGAGMLLAGRSDGSERFVMGVMAASDVIDSLKPAATAQPPGLPADYKETEAKAFVDARRASGEVAGLPADYKKTELKAGETAQAYNPVAGFTASGRGESRTNVNDVDQTGTNTGFKGADYTKANTMLKNLGITGVGYGAFESNALQGGRPGVNINYQEAATFDLPVEEAESYSSQKPGAEKPLFAPTMETKLTGEANFKVTDPIIADASPKMGTSAAYMEQFKRDDLGSIEGLRAAEASKGLLYASGQYWRENPKAGQEGESDFEKITKEQYNAIKNSDQHAQEFAADKIKQTAEFMKNPGEEPIASSPVESPVDMNESPAKFEVPLTDMPSYTEKDHTGRFNIFRRS